MKAIGLLERIGASRNALSSFLDAEDAPLGALSNRGHDLQRLIAAEKSPEVLTKALERARQSGDLRWKLAIQERLTRVAPTPALMQAHIFDLVSARHISEAASALARFEKREGDDRHRAELGFALALRQNDFAAALRHLEDAYGSRDAAPAHRLGGLAEALLKSGQYELADEAIRTARERHPENVWLATLAVRSRAVLSGATAAGELLSDLGHALPPGSPPAIAAGLELMQWRGRHREALEQVTPAIERHPNRWELYAQAEVAAALCDRSEVYGEIVERALTRHPGQLEPMVMHCRHAANRHDFETAEDLLPAIRERSDWAYQSARLYLACQRGDLDAVDRAYAACTDAGIRFGGAEVDLALFSYFYKSSQERLERARSLLTPFVDAMADDPGFLQTYYRLLLASGREDVCRNLYASLPAGLAHSAQLAPFGFYFKAQAGDDAGATDGWIGHVARTAPPAVNAVSSNPETIRLRYVEEDGAVLLFLTVFNGIEFIDWFLDYYRRLGVDHFFVVDNGSTDGTFERLGEEEDVSLFRNTGSFAQSACGVFWINHLMRRFGNGHWCFHVDMDEAFVFPGSDSGASLSTFLGYLESEGYRSVPSFMLDIYPETLGGDGTDPFVASCLIDRDYFTMPCEIPPYTFIQGGLRSRLTGRSLLMTKAPLVKMGPDVWYLANNHQHTHVPFSDVTGAVLHYKFIGDLLGRVDEAIDRQEHFMGARFYKALRGSLTDSTDSTGLRSEFTVKYEGTRQLIELGLLQSSNNWEAYRQQIQTPQIRAVG